MKCDIGLIGLAVMGENLALNIESRGFSVAVYNRTQSKVDEFINGRASNKNIIGTYSLSELAGMLDRPRKVILMIKAGDPVDEMVNELIDILDEGDIIIDGGNSHYQDTKRRCELVESRGLLYVGCGISGGEEGALKGPSMMPGGSYEAWKYLKPIFTEICAKTNGFSCCDWIGGKGAGHFVKMVHNGIEYGDMQLISEAYQIMRDVLHMSNDEMADIFTSWNNTELNSYLIQITGDILKYKDKDQNYVIDQILDCAGQKGTGKWTGISSLNEGISVSLIVEAVYARCVSSMKDQRCEAEKVYPHVYTEFTGDREKVIEDLRQAVFASKIISYAQGFTLMKAVSDAQGMDLDYGTIALIWREGCIIRSSFLEQISEAFRNNENLENLLLAEEFSRKINDYLPAWRRTVMLAVENGISIPTMSAALSYFDGYTSSRGAANMIQAQRDYFGAHTYERNDRPRGEFYHTDWIGIDALSFK